MLITSRTPLRVSFFGGGTDYPDYFERARGAVLGMAINRYVYISALKLASFIDYRFRVSYSALERVENVGDIQHPVVRAALQEYRYDQPLDINIISDLPANTGLGSSSSFTVGFVNLIWALQEKHQTKIDLAREATRIERDILGERVGVQDQLHAAFGGINRFSFTAGRTEILPMQMRSECLDELRGSLLLVYTGVKRHASATLDEQIEKTKSRSVDSELQLMLQMVDEGVSILESASSDSIVHEFGRLLHEGWDVKRKLSSKISSSAIDDIYQKARALGAHGGKLCGAGGGGFILLCVEPEKRDWLCDQLAPLKAICFDIDTQGSKIIAS